MVISKCEMTLSKVDLEIAHHYVSELSHPEDRDRLEAVFAQIAQEFYLTRELVLAITGHKRLLDGDPDLQRSVQLRNGTIVPSGLFASLVNQASAPTQNQRCIWSHSLSLQSRRTAAGRTAHH